MNGSKKATRISILIFLLIALGFGQYRYMDYCNARNEKYEFTIDLVKSLRQCLDGKQVSSVNDKTDDLGPVYLSREKLSDAGKIISKWTNSKNTEIKDLSREFSAALDAMIRSRDLFDASSKGSSTADRAADITLARANYKAGEEKLFGSSITIIPIISSKKKYDKETKPVEYNLTKKQLSSIAYYIETNFEKELQGYELKKKQKVNRIIDNYTLSAPERAIIYIRQFIETGKIAEEP